MPLDAFQRSPWLALIPAVVFALFYAASRRRPVAVTTVAWLVYACYEYGMERRWLCSGECNIRVDLLLIYPVLLVASFVALSAGIVAIIRRRKGAGP